MLTTTEIEFIRQNYQKLGGTDCAHQLNRSRNAIVKNAKYLGLALTHSDRSNIMKRKLDKPPEKRNVNHLPFTIAEQMTPVNAYLLGFIWADGHVAFYRGSCKIEARFVTDDAIDILPLFQKTGKWGTYIQHPLGCREATIATTNNRPFVEFLTNMDYITKSSAPATKILNYIPNHLKRYWWLGCMDGDGCFNIGNRGQEIGIYSSYNQDWSYFDNLAKELNIEYHFAQQITKKGKSSRIRIVKKDSCIKFINFLYPNGYEFGLKRKFNKAMEMLKRCQSTHILCPTCSNSIYLNKISKNIECNHCHQNVVINNYVLARI
jgi:hypothetical protein